jgi:malate dehydrogenase (oxaloacetate-decarboxylating)(NADP+)
MCIFFRASVLAAISVEAKYLPESVFLVAAAELARQIHQSDLDHGTVYPKLTNLRTISFEIAVAVANHLYDLNLAKLRKTQKSHGLTSKI